MRNFALTLGHLAIFLVLAFLASCGGGGGVSGEELINYPNLTPDGVDFKVGDEYVSSVYVGEIVILECWIHEDELLSTTGPTHMEVYVNGSLFTETDVPAFGAFGEEYYMLSDGIQFIQAGTFPIRIVADSLDQQKETDETDNEAIYYIEVLPSASS